MFLYLDASKSMVQGRPNGRFRDVGVDIILKGLVPPRDYGFCFNEIHVIEGFFKFFLPIFIFLSDIEESIIRFQILHFQSAKTT